MRVIDFMPPRGEDPDVVRIVEGIEGAVQMRMELVIRFDYGSIVPWVRRVERRHPRRGRRAGRDRPADAGGAARREPARRSREFAVAAGRARPVRPDLVPLPPRLPARDRPGAGARGDVLVLARVGRPLHVCRPWQRRRDALADGAEGADVRADRRDRRGADDVAARADRRRAELGLPLLLAPRRDLRPLRARSTTASSTRRGRGGSGCCARSPATRTTCRSCTARPASGGCSSSSCRGSPATRARSRCGSATPPARQFQLDVYGEVLDVLHQARRRAARARRGLLGAAAHAAREPRAALARAGRGDLGGARTAAPLHALEGDGLGGDRPRREGRRGLRSRGRRWSAGARCATRSTRRCWSGLRRGAGLVRAVVRLETARRERC